MLTCNKDWQVSSQDQTSYLFLAKEQFCKELTIIDYKVCGIVDGYDLKTFDLAIKFPHMILKIYIRGIMYDSWSEWTEKKYFSRIHPFS